MPTPVATSAVCYANARRLQLTKSKLPGKGKNMMHLHDEVLHIRVWMNRVYLNEIYGTTAAPRLGGWAW